MLSQSKVACGVSESELQTQILRQVEYYMGDENYPNDRYLKQVESLHQGWIPIHVICAFRKLRALSENKKLIVNALRKSESLLEVSSDGKRLRRRYPAPSPAANTSVVPSLNEGVKRPRNFGVDENVSDPAKRARSEVHSATTVKLSTADRLRAFHEQHFGALAKKRFFFGQHRSASVEEDYWSQLCTSCSHYWNEYYHGGHKSSLSFEAQASHGPDSGLAPHPSKYCGYGMGNQADAYHDREVGEGDEYGEEGEEAEYEEDEEDAHGGNQQSLLTPEMIAIFRHSEKWKKEKAKWLAEAEEKGKGTVPQAVKLATVLAFLAGSTMLVCSAVEVTFPMDQITAAEVTRQSKEAMYGSEGAYKVAILEHALEEKNANNAVLHKPVVWPILPIKTS
ncbi:hypothetical protein DFJ77DRAFT_440711 [Powellomyces hirtus]|nr:hypothetical protein DFJ77DRAFT_440711 [Powellomyces hirtus]